MYVHLPPDWTEEDKRPAVVFFFGGGWARGSTDHFKYQATYFALKARFIVNGIAWDTEIDAVPRVGDSVQLLKEGGAQIDEKVSNVRWILQQRGNSARFEHLRVDCEMLS